MPTLHSPVEPSLASELESLQTLGEVARRWPILDVIVQDEFTHDVLAALPDGRALAFDAT